MKSPVTLSLFPVTVTKHQDLSRLHNRKLLSLVLEPKSRMKVLAGLVPAEAARERLL